jgi:hypothetical protein
MRPKLQLSLGRFLYMHQDESQRFEAVEQCPYETVGAWGPGRPRPRAPGGPLRGRPFPRDSGAHGGTPLHKLGLARHSSEHYLRV